MVCVSRMEILSPPTTTIFGIIIGLESVIASLGNILILLVIIRMKNRTRSTVILSSLAVSDFLVGTVVGFITTWQLLSPGALKNCLADVFRGYFVILLVGSSVLTLAVISYDRYLLLTKLQNYSQFMSMRKAGLLIICAWLFPALIPIIRQVHTYTYLIVVFLLFSLPLLVLGVCYYFITMAVRQKERELQSYNDVNDEVTQATDSNAQNEDHQRKRKESRRQKQLKHIRLAKSVMLLIACYIICIIPINTWIIFEMSSFDYSLLAHQTFYLVGVVLMQSNSCINPFIYFSRNVEFRRGLQQLFNTKKNSAIACVNGL